MVDFLEDLAWREIETEMTVNEIRNLQLICLSLNSRITLSVDFVSIQKSQRPHDLA